MRVWDGDDEGTGWTPKPDDVRWTPWTSGEAKGPGKPGDRVWVQLVSGFIGSRAVENYRWTFSTRNHNDDIAFYILIPKRQERDE